MPGKGIPGGLSGWASAFGSGHDPGVLGSSPSSGSLQGGAASPSACASASLCVSHEWINKILKKKKRISVKKNVFCLLSQDTAIYCIQTIINIKTYI